VSGSTNRDPHEGRTWAQARLPNRQCEVRDKCCQRKRGETTALRDEMTRGAQWGETAHGWFLPQKGTVHTMATQEPHDEQRQPPNGADGAEASPDISDEMSFALIEEQADASIRRVWHKGRWYFSIIDVIGLLTDAPTPRTYWAMMKERVQSEGFRELLTKCEQLKMTAADGKQRRTDAADSETILRLVQSVPSPKAEPVKQWLAKVGAERVEEVTRPLDVVQVSTERAALVKPEPEAPALAWAEYYEQLATLYRRQAAYEAQLVYVEVTLSARLEDHEEQIGSCTAVWRAWRRGSDCCQNSWNGLARRPSRQSIRPSPRRWPSG